MTARRTRWVALGLAVAACHLEAEDGAAPPPVVVRCAPARPESVDETVVLRGRVEAPPGGSLAIASQTAGRVVSLAVHEGQVVTRGQVIATVDDAPSRDSLRQAEAAVIQARATESEASSALEHTRALVARGIAAQQDLVDAEARADTARAAADAARSGAQLARQTLDRVTVRSAFAGVVTRVLRGVGALVDGTEATPVAELTTSGALELVAAATERELAAIAPEQHARGTWVDGRSFDGVVVRRSTSLDAGTGLGTVRIALSTTDPGPLIGALGRVTVTTRHRERVPVLPTTALRGAVADGAEVALCQGGVTELRALRVGWRDDERFEVLSGLAPGDRVAIDHVLGLDDGTPIEAAP